MPDGQELVVLCAPDGSAIGTLPKLDVHHRDTPLHLAFSCYLFDPADRLLVTRRALSKRTWPGVRTNSCCGHPAPGESMSEAVFRRLHDELGVRPRQVELLLPAFAYRAEMLDGTVENELCPVYRAYVEEPVARPDPDEVCHTEWVPWTDFAAQVKENPYLVSPWCARQVAELVELGDLPSAWPAGAPDDLPTAARA